MRSELPDIHVDDMVQYMAMLDPMPPITAEYSRTRKLSKEAKKIGGDGYTQKAHMIGWFLTQPTTGKGAYTRRRGNDSSRRAYNRFLNQYGLLWMAEAFGESEGRLRKAIDAANEAEKINYRGRCNAFREVIPFDRLLELIDNPNAWQYDPRVTELVDYDESGVPSVREDREQELIAILEQENCI